MKHNSEQHNDQEHLLSDAQSVHTARVKAGHQRSTLLTFCLYALGVLVLLGLGFGAAVLSVAKIPAFGNRFIKNATLEDLPKLAKLDLVTPKIPGTNSSVGFDEAAAQSGGLFLAPVNPNDLQVQPTIAPHNTCTYGYEFFLDTTRAGAARADFRRASGRVEIEDVRQGTIGDCGFLASVIALIANNQQEELKFALQKRETQLIARFFVPATQVLVPGAAASKTMKAIVVRIDDGLPFTTKDGCQSFQGAMPCIAEGRPIMFVPMLEKAWAKFLDAIEPYPRDSRGYLGMTGTPAREALQALTGGNGRLFERQTAGLSLPMASFLVQCINLRRACVVGSPPIDDIRLGPRFRGSNAIDTEAGVITPVDSQTYQLQEKGTNRNIDIVNLHYYGLEATQPIDGELITFDNAEVIIHNPWCFGNIQFCVEGKNGRQRVLLKSIPHLFTGVEWADPVTF